MTAATSRLRRRGIGAGVAALVGLSGLGFAAMPAQAAAGFDPAASQVSGVDRFDTAAQIATKAFPGGASTVVVANGDRAIDAQAGAYAAGLNNAPILLTQKSNVPTSTVNAIKTLGATKAIVLGDSNSVDATALAQMTAAGLQVQVVSGTDRFATAAAIYNLGSTKSSTVFLARADLLAGQVSPDALAASPLSFDGTPVLLTNAGSLPSATANAITSGGVKNVVVLGNAITQSVKDAVTALGATVTTIAGDDRSLTAQKIAEYGAQQGKYGNTTATIANGDKIDALAAGPWAALNKAPILLTLGTNSLGTGTTNYLSANAATLTAGVAFGDTNSVPTSLTTAAKAAATVPSNQAYSVSPTAATTKTVSVSGNNAGVLQYTVSGLGTTKVDLALADAANVTVGTGGAVTFKQSSGAADFGAPTGAITVVNGVGNGNNNTTALGVTPVNGQVTFTVDSAVSGSSVPVVYAQPASGNALAVGSTGAPTGSFGIGGAVTWAPVEAAAFSNPAGLVTAIDTANSTLWLDTSGTPDGIADVSVKWAAGDRYAYTSNTSSDISSAQFLSWLSVGDEVSVSGYNPGSSRLTIANDIPAAPTNVSASYVSTAANISVSFTKPSNPDVVGYDLQRAAVTGGVVGTFATVAQQSESAAMAAGYKFTDAPSSAGTYAYRVLAANNNGDLSPVSAVAQATVPTTPAATSHVGAPKTLATNGATFQDNNNNGNVDSGDILRLTFDERMAAPASDASLQLTDGNTTATVGTVTNGVNSTWSLNSDSNTIVITLTGGPVIGTGGTNPGIQYPATVTGATGVADTGAQNTGGTALNWNVAATGQDVTF